MTPATVALAILLVGAIAGLSLRDAALAGILIWFAAWLVGRARG